jgi:hypothetical protein
MHPNSKIATMQIVSQGFSERPLAVDCCLACAKCTRAYAHDTLRAELVRIRGKQGGDQSIESNRTKTNRRQGRPSSGREAQYITSTRVL